MQLLFQAQHQHSQMVAHDGVHHRGRLVVKHALRLRRQRPRDRDGAPYPVERSPGYASRASGDVDHFQQPVDDVFLVLLVVVFAQFERKQNILGDGQRIEQRARLENHGHLAADAVHLGFA